MTDNLAMTESHSQALTRTWQRRWLRRAVPLPWVWGGLLPLVGLAALVVAALRLFAPYDIESPVRLGISQQLQQAGQNWVKVDVSGQHVRLSGRPPTAGAGEAALQTATQAHCPTWLGPRICAVEVLGQFDSAAALAPSVPAQTQVAAAQACEDRLLAQVKDSHIEFESGSAEIRATSAPLLGRLAASAQDCPGLVRVLGHTDSVGNAEANQALSEARAAAVVKALAARGVPTQRLASEGFGATQPTASNATSEGRAKNRRIEFKVTPQN